MTVVIWSSKFNTINLSLPMITDIHHWRFMAEKNLYIDLYDKFSYGLIICTRDEIVFVPNLALEQVIKYEKEKIGKVFHFHFHIRFLHPGFCSECNGSGKFDWIQKMYKERRLTKGRAKFSFIRDEKSYYVHQDSNKHIFSKVQLDKGETYCPACSGFGIKTDGRLKVFRGLNNIKNKLTELKRKD